MHPDFFDIAYLAGGTLRQQSAYRVLTTHGILNTLKSYTPVLTGTVPLGIDIESSDLDIICYYKHKSTFLAYLQSVFAGFAQYNLSDHSIQHIETVIVNFWVDDWPIEIFAQSIPVKEQAAYVHMLNEYRLLNLHGEGLKQKVIALKKQGYKTEPAFAKALNLPGNSYEAMLNLF